MRVHATLVRYKTEGVSLAVRPQEKCETTTTNDNERDKKKKEHTMKMQQSQVFPRLRPRPARQPGYSRLRPPPMAKSEEGRPAIRLPTMLTMFGSACDQASAKGLASLSPSIPARTMASRSPWKLLFSPTLTRSPSPSMTVSGDRRFWKAIPACLVSGASGA